MVKHAVAVEIDPGIQLPAPRSTVTLTAAAESPREELPAGSRHLRHPVLRVEVIPVRQH